MVVNTIWRHLQHLLWGLQMSVISVEELCQTSARSRLLQHWQPKEMLFGEELFLKKREMMERREKTFLLRLSWVYFSIKQSEEKFVADKHIIIGVHSLIFSALAAATDRLKGLRAEVKDVGNTWDTVSCLHCEGFLLLLLPFLLLLERVYRSFGCHLQSF